MQFSSNPLAYYIVIFFSFGGKEESNFRMKSSPKKINKMTVEFSGSRKSNERSRRTRGYRHLFHHFENFPFSFFSTQHLFESLVLLKIFPSVIRGRLLFVEDGETNVCRKKQFLQISFFSFAKSNKSFGAKK